MSVCPLPGVAVSHNVPPQPESVSDIYAVIRKPTVTQVIPVAAPAPELPPITVSGMGLHICEEDKMASFVIDGGGRQGRPDVRIEGELVMLVVMMTAAAGDSRPPMHVTADGELSDSCHMRG